MDALVAAHYFLRHQHRCKYRLDSLSLQFTLFFLLFLQIHFRYIKATAWCPEHT